MHAALLPWTLSLQLLVPLSGTPSQRAQDPGAGLDPEASLACGLDWIPTFGGLPGMDDKVFAATVFDDGEGPALYVGGELRSAGGVSANLIAKWDGSSWSSLGSGMSTGASKRLRFFPPYFSALYLVSVFSVSLWPIFRSLWAAQYAGN